MRTLVLLSMGAALVGSFFAGRMSGPAPAAAARNGKVLTAKQGDTIRIPGIATRCVLSQEAGAPDMLCEHSPRGRFELVVIKSRLFVYRNGDPDHPRFSARWKP